MIGIAWFNFRSYSRTYKLFPPAACYILLLLLNYSTAPNPVLSSFGSTMMLNFLMISWFTLSFMQSQNKTQQAISLIHLKSRKIFFISSYLCMGFLSLLLSLISVVYPLIIGAFDESVSVGVLLFSVFNHFVISIIAVCITMLVTKNIVNKQINSWLGLGLILSVLLSTAAIDEHSSLYVIQYILPPISSLINIMNNGFYASEHMYMLFIYAWGIGYSIVLILVFIFTIKRKDMI